MSTRKINKSDMLGESIYDLSVVKFIELQEKNKHLEEENKNLKEIWDNREEKIADLEIEICRLKEENERLKAEAIEDIREIALLEIENKKLKKDLAMYEQLRDQLFGGLEPEDLYEDEDVVKDGNTYLDLDL